MSSGYIDWKRWRAQDFGHCDVVDAVYFAAEVPLADVARARVLEIGFGNGSFLGWAQGQGAEAYGLELEAELVRRAKSLLGAGRAFESFEAMPAALRGQFRHVVAFDVLEHIPQDAIVRFLASIRQLLSSEGRCTLRFPNGDSPFGRSIQNSDPTHVTAIGRGKLEYFAQQAGLAVAELRAPAMPIAGLGARRAVRRATVRALRWLIEGAVGNLYYGGRFPLDPNYVAVLIPAAAAH